MLRITNICFKYLCYIHKYICYYFILNKDRMNTDKDTIKRWNSKLKFCLSLVLIKKNVTFCGEIVDSSDSLFSNRSLIIVRYSGLCSSSTTGSHKSFTFTVTFIFKAKNVYTLFLNKLIVSLCTTRSHIDQGKWRSSTLFSLYFNLKVVVLCL